MQAASLSELKPLMPDVEITTGLLPYLLTATLLLFLLLLLLVRLYRKRKSQPTPKAAALKRLKQMDFTQHCDTQMLYQFSLDAKCYLDGQEDKAFEALQQALTPYKYQNDASVPTDALRQKIHTYIKALA